MAMAHHGVLALLVEKKREEVERSQNTKVLVRGLGTMSYSSSGVWSRSSSKLFFSTQTRDVDPHNFANVEDMLFEVFRCEETDSIDSISISQFLKVSFFGNLL